jgi:hypothetical protein
MTPLYGGSARRTDLYLTTHKTHKRQTSTPPEGFEHPTPANERPQPHALDRAATSIGDFKLLDAGIKVAVKNTNLWDVTPWRLAHEYQPFGETFFFHLQG